MNRIYTDLNFLVVPRTFCLEIGIKPMLLYAAFCVGKCIVEFILTCDDVDTLPLTPKAPKDGIRSCAND